MNRLEAENGERIENTESEKWIEDSTVISKLAQRLDSGKPADVICLDVDGTVYEKIQKPDGSWEKKGDNRELSRKLQAENIPCILISGRPDWNEACEQEMQDLGLIAPDVIIAGGGSIIYWRNKDGTLIADKEFLRIMREQKVSEKKEPGREEFIYDPTIIADTLDTELAEFSQDGFETVRVDTNSGVGFTTVDITDMKFEKLSLIVEKIRNIFSGVKVTFSEDLEKVSADSFSGWIQVLPLAGGKDGATRYALDKLGRAINPASIDSKRLQPHIFGDASIDIWMLSLGSSISDQYDLHQYALGNLTPYAKAKLDRLIGAFEITPDERERIKGLIESGEIENVEYGLRAELTDLIKKPKSENSRTRHDEVTAKIRELSKIAIVRDPNRRRANLQQTTNTGPDGVFEAVSKI